MFLGMVFVVALSLAAFQAPCTSLALGAYLHGTWTVKKEFSYVRGGKCGTFDGKATFTYLPGDDSQLSYIEDGTMLLQPERITLTARRRLLYDCTAKRHVRVSFDEASSRDPADMLRSARFFHDIWLAEDGAPPPPFDHPCGPDMYTGRLLISEKDAFALHWRVDGPRKSGMQSLLYTRATASI